MGCLCLLPLAAGGQEKFLVLHATDARIEIDGLIDSCWAGADSATVFFQLEPYYHKPPIRSTVAKVISPRRMPCTA